MKMLHVGMGWFGQEVGGLSRYMTQAVLDQASRGHEVRALVTGDDQVQRLSHGHATAFAGPLDGILSRLASVRRCTGRILQEFQPDVVACHFALYGRPSLSLLSKRPWVMHFHGPWALEGGHGGASRWSTVVRKKFLETPVYRRAPRVITLSRAFAEILQREYGVDPDRIRIVPGGFDPEPFHRAPTRRAAREQLGLPLDRPTVVCVRRIQSRMGLENLIEAALELRRTIPDLLVLIAGKGPILAALQSRVAELELGETVRFLGFVPDADLPALYAAGDLSVVPTVALEGFGLIVAESMASGTPVVASAVGALPELLSGFTDHLLAQPNADDLARVIGSALSGQVGVPTSAQCREYANRWTWEQVTPKLEAVYAEAAKRSH